MASQIHCREPTPPIDDMFGHPTPPADLLEFIGATPSRGSTASLGDATACEAGVPITGTNTPPSRIPFHRLKYWYATVMPTCGLPTQPPEGPDLDPNWAILFEDLEAIASTDPDEMVEFYYEDESYIAHNSNSDFSVPAALEGYSSLEDVGLEGDRAGLRGRLWERTEPAIQRGIFEVLDEGAKNGDISQMEEDVLGAEEAFRECTEVMQKSRDFRAGVL